MTVSITALSQYLFEDLHENLRSTTLQNHLSRFAGPTTNGFIDEDPYKSSRGFPVVRFGGQEGDGRSPTHHERDSCEVQPGAETSALGCYSLDHRYHAERLPDPEGLSCSSWAHDALPIEVASHQLLGTIAKKFRDLVNPSAEDAAYEKFLAVNSRAGSWELNVQFSWEEELLGTLKSVLDDFFHPGGEPLDLSPTAVFDRGRCGPGASLGANGVDFYTKLFSSDLTATSLEVYYQYAAWCATDPNWRDAEFDRLTTFGLPTIMHESSVTFVQKNRDTMRTICTEPSLNMFAQLGVGAILEDRLRSFFGIDFSVQQDRNAELARLGSIDGAIDTIDLESASDSLSLKMLDTILPQWVMDHLCEYRCLATKVRGKRVPLNMISTMGNGFTFPLQTIIFACCVQAVARQEGAFLRRASGKLSCWGVFGDDIACPSFLTRRLVHLLGLLGFTVNSKKSYTERYMAFRESCGRDYYRGHNVRGVYLKTLKTPQSRYVAINLLNEWSVRWGVPLRRTIGYLRDSVRVLAIPPWASPDAGIRLPYRCLLSGYIHMYRSDRWRYSYLFRCYEAYVPSLTVLEDKIAIPRNLNRVTRRVINPSGLLIAAIGGYLRGGRIPLSLKQGENPSYRMRTVVTPFWGPSVEQVRSLGLVFWEQHSAVVSDNLGF